jgi:hypothetical protein
MRASPLWAVAKILFASGFTAASAYAAGRWFLRRTGAWRIFTALERRVFGFAIGAAWLSNVVFLLCATHLVYPWILVGTGAALIVAGSRGETEPALSKPGAGRAGWLWLLAPIAACYGYLYLAHAMAPEISPDGAGYHLSLTGRYFREHGFRLITTNMYALLSQGMEMLFLFAYAFGRHSAAKLVHFAFLLSTAAAMLSFGRRFRIEQPAAVAAAFFTLSPVVGVDGTSSYNDCALALFTFLVFYLLLFWESNHAPELLPAIGISAGFCYAIKYTGFLALPFALGFLMWKRRPWKEVRKVAGFASLFIIPWMLKNAILASNPFAPFFNRLFPNPYIHVSFEQTYAYFMRHYSGLADHNWSDYLQFPRELAVAGGKLQGLLGPLFLLAPLGLLSLRKRLGRRVCLGAALFALPWFSNIGTRFLIPALVFISLAMALAIWEQPKPVAAAVSAILVAAHAVACWPPVTGRWNRHPVWRLGDAPWRAALRLEPENEYVSRAVPAYNAARMIDRLVPPGGRVFSPEAIPDAYTSREVIVSYQSALGEILMDDLLTPVLRDFGPVWTFRFEWNPQDLKGVRFIQTASHESEKWSIHEVLLFSGEDYLVPRPSWRLRADPNPWDAALAMDGSPTTRWRSWRPLYPGMRFQVDFPEPMRLSAVELRCSPDQPHIALRVEGEDAAGRWSPLPAKMKRFEREAPIDQMKKLAGIELRSRGVSYLLTDLAGGGMNLIAPHIGRNPQAWGFREIGAYGSMRLYRIEN